MALSLHRDRGNAADYHLGTIEGWDAFEVVRWGAVEELNQPYRYDITVRRSAARGPIDLDGLIDTGATFHIATEKRWRAVHGAIAEAEELDRTETFFYYRLLIVPPLWRMRFRHRCRTFVGRTWREIVTCLLENRAYPGADPVAGMLPLGGPLKAAQNDPARGDFEEPRGRFTWRITDTARLDDRDLYRFVAQHNETDLDLLLRLVAAEGITFYFEHTDEAVVLVLTDAPGQDPLHEEDFEVTLRGGASEGGHDGREIVRWLRKAHRMRSRSVTLRDYDHRRSAHLFDATSADDDASAEAWGHFEFPARDERGARRVAEHPATVRRERFEAEARLRSGMSTCRILSPGHALSVCDGDGLRDDEDLVLVRVETFATQHALDGSLLANEAFGFNGAQAPGGLENRFSALPKGVPYRPPPPPPRSRIWGVQVARVWGPGAEEANNPQSGTPDIHCDEHGRVQVLFPWCTRRCKDGMPPSDWLRVAQSWAGAGYGAAHIPRVGHEVLVAYENGDPDRPVVVGSVYTQPGTPPPYDAADAKSKTRTTLKSKSSTVAEPRDGSNELRFTDYAGEEEIYLHAERDLNEVIEHNHSTSVGGDQSNCVGGNQTNTVGHNRAHDIGGTESVHVKGDRTTAFDANESHAVAASRTTKIGSVDHLHVGGSRVVEVTGPDMAIVSGDDATQVGGARTVQVGGDHTVETSGCYHSSAGGNHTFRSTHMYITQAGEFQVNAAKLWLNIGGASLRMGPGLIHLDNGAGSSILLMGSMISLMSSGATVATSLGPMLLNAHGDLNAAAPTIHLNG